MIDLVTNLRSFIKIIGDFWKDANGKISNKLINTVDKSTTANL